MNDFPNDFRDIVTGRKTTSPISAAKLMQNFAWAKLVVADEYLEDATQAEFPAKRLKLPPIIANGTHILASVEGVIQWVATEEC